MASWTIFNWVALNCPYPSRLAGTWKAYSGSAISQLTRITAQSGNPRNRRCPYHATVMNTFEQTRSKMVRIGSPPEMNAAGARRPRPRLHSLTPSLGDLDLRVGVRLHLLDDRLPQP